MLGRDAKGKRQSEVLPVGRCEVMLIDGRSTDKVTVAHTSKHFYG